MIGVKIGVKIGEKHTYNDWGLILSNIIISPPVPQINMISVPLRDGSLDLTDSLTNDVKYNDRTITMTFSVVDPRSIWSTKISEIANYLHGKRLKIIIDDDIAFYYVGRVNIDQWESDKRVGKIVIIGTVDPFKYDILSSAVDWEWDIFDFEDGIINEMGNLIVKGTRKISLICRRKRMFPMFTADTAMTVTFEGETFNLSKGIQKMYDIFLCEGENELVFKGNGTVAIDYIGGSL